MATSFFGGSFFGGEFFNQGGAGARPDDGGRKRKLTLPFKPTGLLGRPKAKDARVQERLDDASRIQAELAGKLAREFGDETQRFEAAREAKDIVEMSMAEVDREIGTLLRKKLRTDEDEVLLLLLMVAAAA